ncbi:MAG TPA: Ig-like domain-containing protein [Acidobacteriaceae bacterium]|nr:Ig-like domain-containing protein [Acidobacteriaceae bacterium]
MKKFPLVVLTLAITAAPAFATVTVTTPTNGETTGTSVQFAATGSTTCSKGVSSMGIYVNNALKYQVSGAKLATSLTLGTGWNNTVVQEWDYCGGSSSTARSIDVTQSAGVSLSAPANGATVSNPVSFVASATTSCAKGVASIGVYIDNGLAFKTSGSQLNKQLTLGGGGHQAVVEEWDNCGGAATKSAQITVAAGKTLSALQASGGWNQWGELPPNYNICTSDPCGGVNWSMYQHDSSFSLSGNATQFNIGGSTPYSDVLWSNPVIGQGSTQGLSDTSHTLLTSLHHFTYDAYFYVSNLSATQSLEFDVNMYFNSVGMEWGTQCDHLGSGQWDIWNNVDAKWVPSGSPCKLEANAWNHVTLQVERESNNDLLYQSITLNGVTYTLNKTVAPFQVPSGWWGATVNYQMDGNFKQVAYTTYLDKFTLTYY